MYACEQIAMSRAKKAQIISFSIIRFFSLIYVETCTFIWMQFSLFFQAYTPHTNTNEHFKCIRCHLFVAFEFTFIWCISFSANCVYKWSHDVNHSIYAFVNLTDWPVGVGVAVDQWYQIISPLIKSPNFRQKSPHFGAHTTGYPCCSPSSHLFTVPNRCHDWI